MKLASETTKNFALRIFDHLVAGGMEPEAAGTLVANYAEAVMEDITRVLNALMERRYQ